MTRRSGFSFLLSIIIHLIAVSIIAIFVITTPETLSDAVQVEWVRMSQPKPKLRRMVRQRIITKPEVPPLQKTSDTLPQKFPPVWTAVSPETYHQEESVFLPPMPSVPVTDFLFIPSSRVDFSETKKLLPPIQFSKVIPPSRAELTHEELPRLSSILESMTPPAAEPVRQEGLSPYLRKVRQQIVRVKKYPSAARKFSMEGTVHLAFTILSNGKIESVEVTRSSGCEILDQAAVLAIKNAAPFPPFPKSIRRESLRIELPLAFKLRE